MIYIKRENSDFSKGSVAQNILRLALPLTLAQLVNALYNIVDRIYLGHIPDASMLALTGVGLVFPITTLVSGFANLFGMGGVPLFSIARGEGDEKKAASILGNVLTLLLISGGILTVVCYIFKCDILFAFGASAETIVYADGYASIYLIGTIFVMLTLGLNGFINAQGFGGVGMMTIVIGAVINAALDPVFIFALDMGVKGAALATIIAQAVSAVWIFLFLTGKKAVVRLEIANMRLRIKNVLRIVSLGVSGFVMSITTCAVQVVCNKLLSIYGGDLYIGVMTVVNSVRELMFMPIHGLTSASQPVIGFNFGAGLKSRVKKAIGFVSAVTIIYGFVAWLVVELIPEGLVRIFSDDAALIGAAPAAMRIYFFSFFCMSMQMSGQTTFLALGKSKQAIFFSLLRKAIIVIPLTLWLPTAFGLGVDGVFLAEPISNVLGGGACFITMLATILPKLSEKKGSSRKVGG